MIRIDRLCVWIFMLGFALLIPSYQIFSFADELMVYLLLGCALTDCVVNSAWRKYRPLLIFLAVMATWLLYSLFVVHYNIAASVVLGWFLEMKPFIPILVFMAVAPIFGETEKRIFRGIALFNGAILLLSLPVMAYARALVFGHDALYGTTAVTSAVIYLYCSIDEDTGLTRKGILVAAVIMTLGLMSTRSKFYAEYIIGIFLLLGYRQQMTRHLTIGRMTGLIILALVIIAAVWNKLNSYFLSGIDISSFDMTSRDEFARLALYGMTFEVIALQPLFGTGFGSYASFASGDPGYSVVYGELGLDKVYGLSPSMHDFISDAYYPSLAQYGIIGITLFIWFWVYVYNRLRPFTKVISPYNRGVFIIGVFIFIAFFIEMTSGTVMFMAPGELWACLLGTICGGGAKLRQRLKSEHQAVSSTDSVVPYRIS